MSDRAKRFCYPGSSLRAVATVVLLGLLAGCGCASLPDEPVTARADAEELAIHVGFLASPELGGRAPRTSGSRDARRYIKARFERLGLQPWRGAKGYDQKFIIGTNVVGVLPGSDPELRDEVVLITAHYDHLGEKHGELHPGAADNAAGVAVLLEAAEQLALSPDRPKRSVAFACFDMEEQGLLGSFAFVARKDFHPVRLAGVVNLDMLGRKFLGAIDDGLFAFGTQRYPRFRETLSRSADAHAIDLLPLGRDLVGPRSDHGAMEIYDSPWVFLSCGEYPDYHKPTDTPDKLDYDALRRAVGLVADAAKELADADGIERPVEPQAGDREELAAIARMIDAVLAAGEQIGLDEAQAKTFRLLQQRARRLMASDRYTLAERDLFATDLTRGVLGVLGGGNRSEGTINTLLILRDLYRHHPEVIHEGRLRLMEHIAHHQPGIFRGTPPFRYEQTVLSDRTVRLERQGADRYRLAMQVPQVSAAVDIAAFGQHEQKLGFEVLVTGDATGTLEELTDYCLLQWLSLGGKHPQVWNYILEQLTGERAGEDASQWIAWRVEQLGMETREQWLLSRLGSGNPRVVGQAIAAVGRAADPAAAAQALVAVIHDASLPTYLRARAISILPPEAGANVALALTDVLSEPARALLSQVHPAFDEAGPFYASGLYQVMRQNLARRDRDATTLAEKARKRLEQLTGQDFGSDVAAWRAWLGQQARGIPATQGG